MERAEKGLLKNGVHGIAREIIEKHHRQKKKNNITYECIGCQGEQELKGDSTFKVMADWKNRDINSNEKIGNEI